MIEKDKIEQREFLILEVLYGLRIARKEEMAWLCGVSDYTYMRKKLRRMVESGHVKVWRDHEGQNCYYLSGRGLRESGRPYAREYEVSANTYHELAVARLAAWLYVTQGVAYQQMQTDVMLRPALRCGKRHRPDLVVGGTCYEVERNHKTPRRVHVAVEENEQRYARQVWVIPRSKPGIRKLIESAARDAAAAVDYLYIEDLERELGEADIHGNAFRWGPSEDEISLETESALSKYFGGEAE